MVVDKGVYPFTNRETPYFCPWSGCGKDIFTNKGRKEYILK